MGVAPLPLGELLPQIVRIASTQQQKRPKKKTIVSLLNLLSKRLLQPLDIILLIIYIYICMIILRGAKNYYYKQKHSTPSRHGLGIRELVKHCHREEASSFLLELMHVGELGASRIDACTGK